MAEHAQGRLLMRQMAPHRALPLLAHAVTQLGDNQSCFMDYGQALFLTNAFAQAQHMFLRAMAIGPCMAILFKNVGVCAMRQQRHAEAIAYLSAAWTMEPSAELAIWIAGAYYELKKYAKARNYFRQALRITGPTVESLNGLGKCYEQQKHYRRALNFFKEALAIAVIPAVQATLHRNLAYCYERTHQMDIAHEHCKKAIRLEPNNIANRFHLVHTYQMVNNNRLALKALDEIDKLVPGDRDAQYARGFLQLLEGNWKEGWPDYEYRWHAAHLKERYSRTPKALSSTFWDGKASLQGKLVMTFCEQGSGDYFNFARYCRHLVERGATVDMLIPPHSAALMKTLPWVRNVYTRYEDVPPHDYHVSLMTMPFYEGTLPETIPPAETPYLQPPFKRERYSERYTVGITWAGDTENPYDYLRSIPDALLQPLLQTSPDIQFVALYVGPKTATYQKYIDEGLWIDGLPQEPTFNDVAAAIDACDLLISVDTANAHLAGAMHKPVWILLGEYTEWRWLKGTLVEKWYPTMRAFRQAYATDWQSVLENVSGALKRELKLRKSPGKRKLAS
jgi:tetratricopeptide (TPR) repeat protein